MFFYEDKAIQIAQKETAKCPHCGENLVPKKFSVLRYNKLTLVKLLILAIAFAVLLWLFAHPVDVVPLFGRCSERIRAVLAAALCVGEGLILGYAFVLAEVKLGHWTRNPRERVYGLRCKSCKKTFAGLADVIKNDRKE